MKTILCVGVTLLCLSIQVATAAQVTAGSAEDKLYQRISREKDADKKLSGIEEFEKQFPQSKILSFVYAMAIDLYREKGDRAKVIEYREKALKGEPENVTVMMLLSRDYAMSGANLGRAVELATQAVDLVARMKLRPAPPRWSEADWKDYMEKTGAAAQTFLDYAKSISNVSK